MTLMSCVMAGDPLILRTYGTAQAIHPSDPDWPNHIARFPTMAGARQIFDLQIDLVQTSCGTGVPTFEFQEQRGETKLLPFYADMGEEGVRAYWQRKNKLSIDGRPTGI